MAQAVAALSPAPSSDQEAADRLNAQTVSLPPQDVPTSFVRNLFLLAGDWFAISQLAKQQPSGASPPTPADQAIKAAFITVETLSNQFTQSIRTSDEATWQRVNALLGALVSAGALASGTYDNLVAMRTPSVPVWPVVLTENDIAAARALTP